MRSHGGSVAAAIRYELVMWGLALFKAIPGRIGCAVRRMALPGSYASGVMIWDGVHVDSPSRLKIGERSSINRSCVLNCAGGVDIGRDVLIGPGVVVYSQNHRYADANVPISRQGYDTARVVIQDDVWIGARAVILPGVTLGRGAVVAAGAVVTKDVPPFVVVGGVPARAIASRGLRTESGARAEQE